MKRTLVEFVDVDVVLGDAVVVEELGKSVSGSDT